jgi:DNA-binding transcriptional ArsR family regulator
MDPAYRRVLIFLLTGTRGGNNRAMILKLLAKTPLNANKIAETLHLDYKTVQHHLKVLEENQVIVSSSPKGTYGAIYFLSPYLESYLHELEEIWGESG